MRTNNNNNEKRPACGDPDSAAHLLLERPAYEAARRRRWGVDLSLDDVFGGPATKPRPPICTHPGGVQDKTRHPSVPAGALERSKALDALSIQEIGEEDNLHFFDFESVHQGIYISNNFKHLSNICSVSIVKIKPYHAQITFSCQAPLGPGCR